MALQFLRRTCGAPFALRVPLQRSGLMPDAIGSEDEVKDRPDQGHEPDETQPCDGGTRITLVEARMSAHPALRTPASLACLNWFRVSRAART